MHRVAKRAVAVTVLAVLLLAGLSFFVAEYVSQAEKWVVFPGSPHVYDGGNIGTGTVTDRDGTLLLDMRQGRVYTDDSALRMAMLHWLGDRDGYISAPAIPHYSAQLAGFDLINGLYSFAGNRETAKLTLSAQVQKTALDALGEHRGTVAVYNYRTGEILCAVTTPTYDPDDVPDIAGDSSGRYEGVYLNRFTQSAYTPGSIFKIVTLAAALDCVDGIEQMQFTCTARREYGSDAITCERAHGTQSLKDAFCNSCNCAFAEISQLVGADTLYKYVKKFGVADSVSFDGITTAQGNFEKTDYAVSTAWSAIGQYTDLVNPCSYLTFVGAIAGGGSSSVPYLVQKAGSYRASTVSTGRIMSRDVAEKVREYMAYTVENKYGSENFPGLTVCAKTGTAEKDGEQISNGLFTGFVDSQQYPLAFFVCVEEGGYGRTACVPIASAVLAACVEEMSP